MTRLARVSKAVTGQLGDLISSRPGMLSDPSPLVGGNNVQPQPPGVQNAYGQWLGATKVPTSRVKEMEYYDYLEREIPDVRKALDAYATMAVTGNLAGGGRAAYTIRLVGDEDIYPPELINRLRRMETLIQDVAWSTIRTMVKYGSYMPEIVTARLDDGRNGVKYIKPIPPGTIFRMIQPNGITDLEKYWIQIIDGKPISGKSELQPAQNAMDDTDSAIPQWKLPHFAIWSNVVSATETILYGSSILQPFGAIGLKMHGTLDSMVLARLTRAAMRYIWQIDVSDIKTDQRQIQRRMSTWKNLLSRSQTLINSNSQADSYKKPPTPDQDFFVPAADGLKWGLDKVEGDANLARVNDVELLARYYFGALGVPPEYLGHERSQGGRSNLSQIDIHFARTVRHMQMFGASGFEHVVWVDMMLGGWDPREYPIRMVPPPIGARDDLLQAQIRALQSSVVSQLQAAGMRLDVNPKWILQTFLNMDEEIEELEDGQIDEIFEELNLTGSSEPPPESRRKNIESVIRNMHKTLGPIFGESIKTITTNNDHDDVYTNGYGRQKVEDIVSGLQR